MYNNKWFVIHKKTGFIIQHSHLTFTTYLDISKTYFSTNQYTSINHTFSRLR